MNFEPVVRQLKNEKAKHESAMKQLDTAIAALTAKPVAVTQPKPNGTPAAVNAKASIAPKPAQTIVATK